MERNINPAVFVLFVLWIAIGLFACSPNEDDAVFYPDELDDDDDAPSVGDDDAEGDDDDDASDDDDDQTPPEGGIRITRPTAGQTLNGSVVDVEFVYDDGLSQFTATLDGTVITQLLTISQGLGWGVVQDVEEGDHTLTISGSLEDGSTTDDQVTFSTKRDGPLLELTLSSYEANTGDIVYASWTFFDESLNDITGQVDVSIQVDNGAEFQPPNEIHINQAGEVAVTARCEYKGKVYTDERTVQAGDFAGPRIVITTPQRGTFATTGSVIVSGTVEDESDIEFLKFKTIQESESNWIELSVDSHGHFTHSFSPPNGMNTVQLWAADEYGNESRGNVSLLRGGYHADGAELANSLGIRINEEGFDSILTVVEDLVNDIDFIDLLPANPIYYGDFFLVTLAMEIKHNTFSVGPVDLNLAFPQPSQMQVTGTVGAIYAEVRIYGEILDKVDRSKLIPYSNTIPVSADGATVQADLSMGVAAGEIYADLTGLTIGIQNFNVGLLPDFLQFINEEISDLIEEYFLEAFLSDLIYDAAAPLISQAIYQLNVDLNQQIALMGHSFDFSMTFDSFDMVDNGVTLWSTVQVEAVDPDGPPKIQPGSYKTYSTPPALGEYVPGTSTPFGFGAVLDDDLFNQALFETYQSGLLSPRIDENSGPELGFSLDWRTSDALIRLVLPQLQSLHPDAPLAVVLRPQIMPVLVSQADGKAMKDSELNGELQVGDFLIDLIVVHPNDGDIFAFTLGLALYIPVGINVDSQENAISFEFAEEMLLEIHVLHEEVNFNDAAFEEFVPMVLDFVLPMIGGLLGEFPIPSFSGYTFVIDEFSSVGSQEDWFGLFGSLEAAL